MPALSALKAHLNITWVSDDNEMLNMLDAAEEWAAAQIGRPLTAGAHSFTVFSDNGVLILPTSVASVTSVATPNGGTATVRSVNAASGIVFTDSYMCGAYTVTVQLPVVPAGVDLAVLIIAAHLWETQRMPGQSVDARPAGFGGADGEPDSRIFSGFAIPNRALEMLQPYISVRVA